MDRFKLQSWIQGSKLGWYFVFVHRLPSLCPGSGKDRRFYVFCAPPFRKSSFRFEISFFVTLEIPFWEKKDNRIQWYLYDDTSN